MQHAPVVGLDVELALAIQIPNVRLDATGVLAATGHLDHDLGRPVHREAQLLDLSWRERARRTAPIAHQIEAV